MKDHSYFLHKAFETAKAGNGFFGDNKTGAIIVLKGKIIAKGTNSTQTHPFAKTFSRHPDAIYLHAEHDAILKASRILSKKDWKRTTLYVARTTKANFFGLAKPCNGCAAAIAHVNIPVICYSMDAGDQLNYSVVNRTRNEVTLCSVLK